MINACETFASQHYAVVAVCCRNRVGNIWLSDKSIPFLNGFISKQNWRIWGTGNLNVALPSYFCMTKKSRFGAPFPPKDSLDRMGTPRSSCNTVSNHMSFIFSTNISLTVSFPWIIASILEAGWIDLYSPDFTPCDFFLWGVCGEECLKDEVYRQNLKRLPNWNSTYMLIFPLASAIYCQTS